MFGPLSRPDQPASPDPSRLIRRRMRLTFSFVSVIALIVGLAMIYIMRTGSQLASIHSRRLEAVNGIQLELTLAHLWFEEILTGDDAKNIQDVWSHYERARGHALAMLDGAEMPYGTVAPVRDVRLRNQLEEILKHLTNFQAITRQRFEAGVSAAAGSDIDNDFDAFFEHLMAHAHLLNNEMHSRIMKDLRNFQAVQGTLLAFFLALTIGLLIIGYR